MFWDVKFWLSKTPVERLAEVVRLRKNYYTWLNGSFPEKTEKVVHYRKNVMFEKDFVDFVEFLNLPIKKKGVLPAEKKTCVIWNL